MSGVECMGQLAVEVGAAAPEGRGTCNVRMDQGTEGGVRSEHAGAVDRLTALADRALADRALADRAG